MSKPNLLLESKRADTLGEYLPSLKIPPNLKLLKEDHHNRNPSISIKSRPSGDVLEDKGLLSSARKRRLPSLSIGSVQKSILSYLGHYSL